MDGLNWLEFIPVKFLYCLQLVSSSADIFKFREVGSNRRLNV